MSRAVTAKLDGILESSVERGPKLGRPSAWAAPLTPTPRTNVIRRLVPLFPHLPSVRANQERRRREDFPLCSTAESESGEIL